MPLKLSFQNLSACIGAAIGPSAPIMVDQARIDGFAAITGDRQWVHVDVDRATQELGGTIAHGYLTLSLVPRLVSELLEIDGVARALNYGLDRVRFPAPLPSGADVVGRIEIIDVAPRGDAQLLRCRVGISLANTTSLVCVAETLTLLIPGKGGFGGFD